MLSSLFPPRSAPRGLPNGQPFLDGFAPACGSRHGKGMVMAMKFFSVDGGLYKFLSRLWDMVKLNFMWLLFSLPIYDGLELLLRLRINCSPAIILQAGCHLYPCALKLGFSFRLLFSLPIVTVGAATVAAYSVTLKMVDEQETIISTARTAASKSVRRKYRVAIFTEFFSVPIKVFS